MPPSERNTMDLNSTVSAERVHIAFFGCRNAGKSSLVNAVTGQALSVVSPVAGTTTDPVKKAMELLPLGPVMITDTAGFDDEGELGALRVKKTNEILAKTDIAVLVVDSSVGFKHEDGELIRLFNERRIPFLIAFSKADIARPASVPENGVIVSAATGEGVNELKERLAAFGKKEERTVLRGLLPENASVVLVIPIDEAAPKGRLILPQQLVLRELLDFGHTAHCCRPSELPALMASLKTPPALVITDSQAFGRVVKLIPEEQPLTSFSILMARYRGELRSQIEGAELLKDLKDGDRVLIAEGCTHHRQCGDIGSVKLPAWIREYSQHEPEFSFSSGGGFPDDLGDFRLIVHCGGCMLSPAEMHVRAERAASARVPMVNYGVAIAKMHGILERSLAPLNGNLG